MHKAISFICLFSCSLLCMNHQVPVKIEKTKKGITKNGFIPEVLMDEWINKHNMAMLWVAEQRIKNKTSGNTLVFYVKNDE